MRARGEYEELKLQAERLRMGGAEAREALGEAIACFHALEALDLARVAYLSAQLIEAAAKLREVLSKMKLIGERYGL
jgi:hypothetical protein